MHVMGGSVWDMEASLMAAVPPDTGSARGVRRGTDVCVRGPRDDPPVETDIWFAGRVEGGPDAEAFLAHVQQLAPTVLGGLVPSGNTAAYPYGCVIGVAVPGVPPSERPVHAHQLQVSYAPGFLGAYWGCLHLWDDFDPADPEALHVTTELRPDEAAERAVAWLAHELQRPRVREEWDRRWLGTSTRWVLADTGRVLGGRSRPPRGRPEPDRVIPLVT